MNDDYSQQLKEFLTANACKIDGAPSGQYFECKRHGDNYLVKIIDKNIKSEYFIGCIPADLVKALIESNDVNAQRTILGLIFKPGPKAPHAC